MTPRPPAHIAILTPMGIEARPVLRALRRDGRLGRDGPGRVETAVIGVGTRRAAAATEQLLASAPIDHVIVCGVAGGIGGGPAIGEVLVPEVVIDGATGTEHRPQPVDGRGARGALWTSDELIVDPGRLTELVGRGVLALDMETAAVAAVCERHGCAWSVYRGISDRPEERPVDPAVLNLLRPDGSPDAMAVARLLITRPWRAVGLARLGRETQRAATAAAGAAVAAAAALAAER